MYYEKHFGLNETPFSISPDPKFLYLTEQHREALAHLLYGVTCNGGFVLLTGEIGAGKTTICHCLLNQLPENVDIGYVLNSKLPVLDFIEEVCDELHIGYKPGSSLKQLIDAIHHRLLVDYGRGRNTVLLVDEAQNLSVEVIEQIRLLSNLETAEKKLLQIILIGQPELRVKLALPELKQMAQRITARFHLGALSKKETAEYITHRLRVAGARTEIFNAKSVNILWRHTKGVPRLINVICDRALLGAYVSNQTQVKPDILQVAIDEVIGKPVKRSRWLHHWVWSACALLLMTGAFSTAYYYREYLQQPTPSKAIFEERSFDNSLQSAASIEPVTTSTRVISASLPQSSEQPAISSEVILPDTEPAVELASFELQSLLVKSNSSLLRDAYESLSTQWGKVYSPKEGDSPCQYLASLNLACLWNKGNLHSLRELNRPALLTLYDDSGRSFPVALVKLTSHDAYISVNGDLKSININNLDQWWYGQFMVLWRIPPAYQQPIKLGNNGKSIAWLAAKLNLESPASRDRYDQEMLTAVKTFQRKSGLIPDGVVGPLTVIALNNLSGTGVPLLTQEELP